MRIRTRMLGALGAFALVAAAAACNDDNNDNSITGTSSMASPNSRATAWMN